MSVAEWEIVGEVTPLDELDLSVIMRVIQDLLEGKEDSIAARELKYVLEVSGIAGMSCEGQMRRLTEVLGKIITRKYGKEEIHLRGLNAEDNQQVRGSNFVNEA